MNCGTAHIHRCFCVSIFDWQAERPTAAGVTKTSQFVWRSLSLVGNVSNSNYRNYDRNWNHELALIRKPSLVHFWGYEPLSLSRYFLKSSTLLTHAMFYLSMFYLSMFYYLSVQICHFISNYRINSMLSMHFSPFNSININTKFAHFHLV